MVITPFQNHNYIFAGPGIGFVILLSVRLFDHACTLYSILYYLVKNLAILLSLFLLI